MSMSETHEANTKISNSSGKPDSVQLFASWNFCVLVLQFIFFKEAY